MRGEDDGSRRNPETKSNEGGDGVRGKKARKAARQCRMGNARSRVVGTLQLQIIKTSLETTANKRSPSASWARL